MAEKYVAHSHGILHTQEGNSYYLLEDHPIDRYPWQNDDQQMWYVVKREWELDESNDVDNSDYRSVGAAFRLVTTYPTIEFVAEDIEVEIVDLSEDETNATLTFDGLPVMESVFDDEYVPDMQID